MVGIHVGGDMKHYSAAAVGRTMKIQEVILRALARKITWWQAAEIIGITDRQMRRWKRRYEVYGYDGLYDRRKGNIGSPYKSVSLPYRNPYRDFKVHPHGENHTKRVSATTTRAALGNHREAITVIDFFTVPTATFRVLYGFFVIGHSRRRILHRLPAAPFRPT